jgi:aspartyl-tRNA(Asn)/glutamyl-tRNA(Gln) amidotransferase subunit A
MSSGKPGDLVEMSARDAVTRIRERALSPVALTEALLARIKAVEPAVLAWVHLDEAGALAAAREREAEAQQGKIRGPLHGVAVGIKDIIHVAGMPTRAGAKAFAHSKPSEDAPSVARLRAAGAIILGKTHTTQFAYRDPSPARNPWNGKHTPGGSSSGSAAAVAARMVPLALGTQTVGSVLRPAAYCGVIGLKGTHGLVPADGVIPLAWSLDHVGAFARSVEDAALLLGVMAARTFDVRPPAAPRLAVATELIARAEGGLAKQLAASLDAFARGGAKLTEVKLPASFGALAAASQRVLEAEAAAYHDRQFAAHAADYGDAFRELVQTGRPHSAISYIEANRVRLQFRDDVTPLLAEYDALLSPTAPGPAPEGLAWTGDASLCAPWSSAGAPSISLPTGVGAEGLPYAIQLSGAAGSEARLLGAAAWCERILGFSGAPACSI